MEALIVIRERDGSGFVFQFGHILEDAGNTFGEAQIIHYGCDLAIFDEKSAISGEAGKRGLPRLMKFI
jgi:hypothetical protein